MAIEGEIITVVVGGHRLTGWQSIDVGYSAKAAAGSFSLEATNPSWGEQGKALRRGGELEIYASGTLLLRGYVDDYEGQTGPRGGRHVGISGRSKSMDYIDCPPVRHKTGRIEQKDLEAVAKELDEFRCGITSDLKTDKIKKVQIVPGESAFQTVEREARRLGVLLVGQREGGIKLTRPGRDRHAGALVEGEAPVEDVRVRLDLSLRRSPVVVRGQNSTGVEEDDFEAEEQDEDKSVGRHRPYLLFNEGNATKKELRSRARWERLRRSGSGISASVTTAGWRDQGGRLWTPPALIACSFASDDVDPDLAVASVRFRQGVDDRRGTHAVLTLVDQRTLGGEGDGKGGTGSSRGRGEADAKSEGKSDEQFRREAADEFGFDPGATFSE